MIKLIAIATMIIDHLGIFLFPQHTFILRSIGSLSFPLFAWLIVQGRFHTSDIKKYLQNLLIFAIISQPIYMMMFPDNHHLNAIFTLFWGLFLICAYERFGVLVLAGLLFAAGFGRISVYVLLILIFYFCRDHKSLLVYLTVLFFLVVSLVAPAHVLFGPLSLVIILWGRLDIRLPVNKYVFYSVYPVHFIILWGVKYVAFD